MRDINLIALELQPATEVGAQEGEDNDPEGEEHLAVEDMPTVGQIGHGEEFQGKGQFDEAEYDLQGVHPGAGLRGGLQPRGEHGEEREWQGQCQGKTEHANGRCQPVARGRGLDEQHAHDGGCAGEGDEHQRESHQEDAK